MDRDRVTRYPLRLAIVCIFRMFVFVARPFAYICKSSVMCVKGAEKSEFCERFQSGIFLKTQRKKKGELCTLSNTITTTIHSNTNNARGRVVRALRERGDDCARGISGRGTYDVRREDSIELEQLKVEVQTRETRWDDGYR